MRAWLTQIPIAYSINIFKKCEFSIALYEYRASQVALSNPTNQRRKIKSGVISHYFTS